MNYSCHLNIHDDIIERGSDNVTTKLHDVSFPFCFKDHHLKGLCVMDPLLGSKFCLGLTFYEVKFVLVELVLMFVLLLFQNCKLDFHFRFHINLT